MQSSVFGIFIFFYRTACSPAGVERQRNAGQSEAGRLELSIMSPEFGSEKCPYDFFATPVIDYQILLYVKDTGSALELGQSRNNLAYLFSYRPIFLNCL